MNHSKSSVSTACKILIAGQTFFKLWRNAGPQFPHPRTFRRLDLAPSPHKQAALCDLSQSRTNNYNSSSSSSSSSYLSSAYFAALLFMGDLGALLRLFVR